ncbi:hypothetical protein DPMN_083306 [Dreissena polymorpha]|uniref:Uncharacterized protein n=1 Tax=Dreissena polymorpha TaxID=45954 RepID=A0A9D3Y8I1_DREPO|nr:hypothetical protein DPMN_083306 [Dreissena polymorpha]
MLFQWKGSCRVNRSEMRHQCSRCSRYALAKRRWICFFGRSPNLPAQQRPCKCKCGKQNSTTPKPKPGGKLLTSDAYIEALEIYDAHKKSKAPSSSMKNLPQTSPKQSTSG